MMLYYYLDNTLDQIELNRDKKLKKKQKTIKSKMK